MLPGGVFAGVVAQKSATPRLVDRDPALDPVTQTARDDCCVVDKRIDGGGVVPTTLVLERLRQIPVVERRPRLNTRLQQRIDQTVVPIQAGPIHRSDAERQDARPGDREAIRIEPQPAHELDILAPAVVVIAGHVSGFVVVDLAGCVAEVVPDGGTAPVLVNATLDLIRRRRRSPGKVGGGHLAAQRCDDVEASDGPREQEAASTAESRVGSAATPVQVAPLVDPGASATDRRPRRPTRTGVGGQLSATGRAMERRADRRSSPAPGPQAPARPARARPAAHPEAIVSLATKTAVGGSAISSSVCIACRPPSWVKSPSMISSGRMARLASTSASL